MHACLCVSVCVCEIREAFPWFNKKCSRIFVMCHPHQPIKLDFTNAIQWHNFIVTVLLSIGPAYFIPAAIYLFQWNTHWQSCNQPSKKGYLILSITWPIIVMVLELPNKTELTKPIFWLSNGSANANANTNGKHSNNYNIHKNRKVRT